MATPDSTASETPAGNGPASYQVVARRYRPQRFADLVGQEHVARGLSGAIESGRIGHAYLFTGARGVGKTSAARIFAKALDCEQGPAPEPCNACEACRTITAGQDVDVVEIDAASNRGIDEIRSLRQNVAIRPARGRFKVYIIDEVHMLTREAFNALLKTLEEPPGHVKFVFCTTEPEKLPITILSRCQRFDFVTVDAAAIARRLAQIVEAEGADVSAEALHLIARRAAGSMRDSQSLLEQLLGSASGPIGVDDVHAVIGTGSEERIGSLLAAIAARDPAAAVAALDHALAGGADPGGVLEQLLAGLRDCLLASVGCGADMLTGSAGLGLDIEATGRGLGTATILAMLQILDQALSRMRTSGHAQVLAEMAVVRLAGIEDLEGLADAVARVAAAEGGGRPAGAAVARPPVRPPAVAPSRTATRPAEPREKKTTELTAEGREARGSALPGPVEPAAVPPRATLAAAPPGPSDAGQPDAAASPEASRPTQPASLPADPLAAWQAASEGLEGLAADFAATAAAAAWKDGQLEVTLPATAATAASFLRRPDSVAAIGQALEQLAGRPVRYAVVLAAATPAAQESQPVPPRPGAVSQAGLVRAATEHPFVSHARSLFDAAIRKVEPPRPAAAAPAKTPAAAPAVAPALDTDAEEIDG
ncbi:MAG: polymerase subunit tau [Planctomycetota bacterium]